MRDLETRYWKFFLNFAIQKGAIDVDKNDIKNMVDIGQKTIHNKALCEDIFGHHTFVILYLRIALHFILMMILV